MSRSSGPFQEGSMRFPRVSGDEPARVAVQQEGLMFSPRERG